MADCTKDVRHFWFDELAANHHAIIGALGHFPHRNAILRGESSAEELQAIADGSHW